MLRTTTGLRAGLTGLALLALCLPLGSQPPGAQDRPAFIKVTCPADTKLEVQGKLTTSTGMERSFITPPLAPGKKFTYNLKATYQKDGKDFTEEKTVEVTAGAESKVSFASLPPPPPPAGSFTFNPIAAQSLKGGDTKKVTVTIKRDKLDGAVALTVKGVPAKVKATVGPIAAGKDSADLTLEAAKDAANANAKVTVTGKAGNVSKDVTFDLKVEAAAPPPATFNLTAPGAQTVKAGETKKATVSIKRDNFKEAVALTFKGVPAKVKIANATIAADKDSADISIVAEKDAAAATAKVTVTAKAGSVTKEATFDLKVEAAPPPPPPATFNLTAPGAQTVKAGETKKATVSIKRDNFKEAVTLTFKGVPAKVKIANATIAADKDSAEISIVAEKDAAAATAMVTVTAKGGTVTKEATFAVKVEAAPPPPPPEGTFSLTAPAAQSVKAGEAKKVTVSIKRDNFKDPVVLTVKGAPAKVKVSEATIAGDKDTAELAITAEKDAAAGTAKITVTAKGGKVTKEASFDVKVEAAPPPPPPQSSLKLSPVSDVAVKAGDKATVEVKIEREAFNGPVAVKLDGLPDKVTAKAATIPANQTSVKIEVSAAADAAEGTEDVKVTASGGALKAEGKVKVKVTK